MHAIKQRETPIIHWSEVFKVGEYIDEVFKNEVREWANRTMDSISMGLLDTTDHERWEITPESTHEAKQVVITTWYCSVCGPDHPLDKDDECCTDGMDEPLLLKSKSRKLWGVVDNNTDNFMHYGVDYVGNDIEPFYDEEADHDGEADVYFWVAESEADDAAKWCDEANYREHGHASHGFPWANGRGYLPDTWVSDWALQGAGFVVAHYTGGGGDQYGEVFRIVGIDGGGYCFDGHFVRLFLLHHESRSMTVQTERGEVYVTMEAVDERA